LFVLAVLGFLRFSKLFLCWFQVDLLFVLGVSMFSVVFIVLLSFFDVIIGLCLNVFSMVFLCFF